MDDDNKGPIMPNWMRVFAIWTAIIAALLLVVSIMQGRNDSASGSAIAYSEFIQQVDAGQVKEVVKAGKEIKVTLKNDQVYRTFDVGDPAMSDRLLKAGVRFTGQPEESPSFLQFLLYQSIPILIFVGLGYLVFRQMQKGAGSGAMGFGKSRAKMLTEKQGRVTFEDVAGIDEAREELQEIVEFLKDPGKFSRLGGKIPKGALLIGAPGTGKTLLARAIAGEAGVPFFTISGSDFVEMFVGVGASRVRDMFEQAKKSAPCIVFIDEIDAVGRHRGSGIGNGNDEREQTLNQLLVEMDGFEANEGIIIIAATNRPDVLDPALLRPGRFDRQVNVPRPDIEGRIQILRVHMKRVPLAPDVDERVIARGTPGFSGADLANLVNEAALLAARKGKRLVAMLEFEEAKDKVYLGAERKSMVMTEDEKKSTAVHEAGHAIVALSVEGNNPLHKVTIIPRGRALGVTWTMPERDMLSRSQKQMKADLAMSFGGRIAEQLIYGKDEINTGAASDLQQATRLARSMVMDYGMSKTLGWLHYRDEEPSYAGSRSHISEQTSQAIDKEVRDLVEEAEQVARKVLTKNLKQLRLLADALLVYETLSGEETKRVIAGEDIGRPDPGAITGALPAVGSSIPKTRRPGIGGPAAAGA